MFPYNLLISGKVIYSVTSPICSHIWKHAEFAEHVSFRICRRNGECNGVEAINGIINHNIRQNCNFNRSLENALEWSDDKRSDFFFLPSHA